jgi:Icc-related predicted phosphoesterase
MKISLISDTHNKQRHIIRQNDLRKKGMSPDLHGGDLILHSGDIMTSGYSIREITEFLEWFSELDDYTHKVFIAGNHDRLFQMQPERIGEILAEFPNVIYLEDSSVELEIGEEKVKIYGSPWQPEFYNWAFNLPRQGSELQAKWEAIPEDVDIVLTHGPAQTYLDTSGQPYNQPLLGCELLKERLELIKPKMHLCGHIHGGHGHRYNGHTHFFNASVLDEQYYYSNLPFNFDWNPKTNEIEWSLR